MQYDSIIFDLDGTLWNTCKGCANTWNLIASKQYPGRKDVSVEDMENCMGKDKEGFRKALLDDLHFEDGNQLLTKIFSSFNEMIPKQGYLLYEGVEQGLKKLSQYYKLFIVSNCQEGYLQMFNQCTGLVDLYIQDFEYIGRSGKPKGENIQNVVTRNQLKSPIYIGDTQSDMDAAKIAGTAFALASYGLGQVKAAKIRFDSFADLVQYFAT